MKKLAILAAVAASVAIAGCQGTRTATPTSSLDPDCNLVRTYWNSPGSYYQEGPFGMDQLGMWKLPVAGVFVMGPKMLCWETP